MLNTAPLVFVDTETTGLNPHTRAVWEVGMIRREPDGTEKRKEFQIELTNREVSLADPKSLEISGYHKRYDPIEAFSKRTAAAFIREFTDGAHVVGMVPDFDTLGLQSVLDYVDQLGEWYYQLIDVDTFAQGVMLVKGTPFGDKIQWPVDTGAITEFLEVDIDESARHTAFGDAEWTMRFYDAVVKFATEG